MPMRRTPYFASRPLLMTARASKWAPPVGPGRPPPPGRGRSAPGSQIGEEQLQLLLRRDAPRRDVRPREEAVAARLACRRHARSRRLAGQEGDRYRGALRDQALGVAQRLNVLGRHLDRVGSDHSRQPLRGGLIGRSDVLGLDAAVSGGHAITPISGRGRSFSASVTLMRCGFRSDLLERLAADELMVELHECAVAEVLGGEVVVLDVVRNEAAAERRVAFESDGRQPLAVRSSMRSSPE